MARFQVAEVGGGSHNSFASVLNALMPQDLLILCPLSAICPTAHAHTHTHTHTHTHSLTYTHTYTHTHTHYVEILDLMMGMGVEEREYRTSQNLRS